MGVFDEAGLHDVVFEAWVYDIDIGTSQRYGLHLAFLQYLFVSVEALQAQHSEIHDNPLSLEVST
jgi:hypothetical protein